MFIGLCIFKINLNWFDDLKLIADDFSKKKVLDADLRVIQQIVFQGVIGGDNNTEIRLYTILEQSKETMLEFSKGTAKVS